MTKEFCEMLHTFSFIILHYNIAYSHYTGDSCTAHFLIHLNIDLQDKKKKTDTDDLWPIVLFISDGLCNHWQRNSVFMNVAWYCHMRLTLSDSLKIVCTEEFVLLKRAVFGVSYQWYFLLYIYCERWSKWKTWCVFTVWNTVFVLFFKIQLQPTKHVFKNETDLFRDQ